MYLLTGWRRSALSALNVCVLVASFGALAYAAFHKAAQAARPVTAHALAYRSFSDPTFDFSIDVPQSFVAEPASPAVPSGGSAFASKDGQGRLVVWSAPSPAGFTTQGALDACQKAATAAGSSVKFTFATDRFYVCRGEEGLGAIFYERGVIGESRSYYFRWEYSTKWRKVYEPAVQRAVDTFTPGPLVILPN